MISSMGYARKRHFSEGPSTKGGGVGWGGVRWGVCSITWHQGQKIVGPHPGGVFPHIVLLFMAL